MDDTALGADMLDADTSAIAFLYKSLDILIRFSFYIWLGESSEWMSVTELKMERGSNRIGSRGEEGKERLQESCKEEEEEESPLQSDR